MNLPWATAIRHSRPVSVPRLLFTAALLVACGSNPPPPKAQKALPPPSAGAAEPSRAPNTLYRDEVKSAVARGMGHFLQHLEVEPVTAALDAGRTKFVGYRIVALRPASAWLRFSLGPGDVITHVNGASVEHYDYLLPVFEALPNAPELKVELLRDGEPRVLSIALVEHGRASASAAAGTAPPANSASTPKN